jgi:DNA-binding GntR family transcriptional regulator
MSKDRRAVDEEGHGLRDDISRPHADASAPTAAERAYGELRRRILDGRLPPGHRLKEAELAAELGLSRTPVRDALSRLTVEGLLDFRANAGATVAVWAERQIELMFRIRSLLEPLAAEVAAPQITDAEVEEMRRLCAVMEEAARRETPADLNRLAEANGRLHRMIIEATHSDQLIKLATLALDTPLSLRIFSRYTTAEIARSMRHHREIVDALSHRDPAWAASAMRTHILASIGVARGSKIATLGEVSSG